MNLSERLLTTLLVGLGVVVIGCSVDGSVNKQRRCKDGYKGFCLEDDGDAGEPPDADVPEPCNKDDERKGPRACFDLLDWKLAWQGECKIGRQFCQDGIWQACQDQQLPREETCNNLDDDCDGLVDEDTAGRDCTVPGLLGVCAQGQSLCVAGQAQCVAIHQPSPEVCDGQNLDRDCDGLVASEDPDLFEPCYDTTVDTGCTPDGNDFACRGQCRAGVRKCAPDGGQTLCEGAIYAGVEVPTPAPVPGESSEPVDEDCNGIVDDGFQCDPSQTYTCYSGPADTRGKGACKEGARVCSPEGNFGVACVGEVTPSAEVCNGLDDDCDGRADNNVPGVGASCVPPSTTGQCLANAKNECNNGKLECVPAPKSLEVCDTVDNDCDGAVDESCGSDGKRTCCGNLACVDTKSNLDHCGGCNQACSGANKACCNGQCVTLGTRDNCLTCGNKCSALESCTDGGCRILGIL